MRFLCAAAGIALIALPGAWAQSPLSLADAVSRAVQSHPLLAAGIDRAAAAAALASQAALRPNPRFTFQTENWRASTAPTFRPGIDIDTFAMLSQTFETAGKRARRTELAESHAGRARLERELLERQVAVRVALAYWAAAGAARVRQLWDENTRTFGQIVAYHEARVREGAMAEGDLLKVRLEGERLALAANTAALDAERARIHLFREMGASEFPPVSFSDPLDLGPEPSIDKAAGLDARPEVRLARLAVETGRANLRLQQAHARPDFDAMLGYKRTAGFNTAVGSLQINLPFFNRNQGAIAAATAETRAAESELAASEALVRAEVESAVRETSMRRAQLTGLLKESLARAAESSSIAQAAYREGGADLLRLLDAERVRIELESFYYRSLAEYRQSVVQLRAAAGVAP